MYYRDLLALPAPSVNGVVRREDTGRVGDEGRPVFEKVDLMEKFFANVHRQIR